MMFYTSTLGIGFFYLWGETQNPGWQLTLLDNALKDALQ
jgi:hypothetical protein